MHMSLALTKSVEEAHEAVEPTTMTMTSDGGPCIPSPSNRPSKQPSERANGHGVARGCLFSPFPPSTTPAATADGWLHLDERALCLWAISTCSSSSSLITSSSGCCHGCGEGVMCVDVPLPRMTMMMMMVDGGRSVPKPS
ncbi:hypothetical protein PTSG_12747 [Salpingoeca rosetta]|uniref:Uncharacterized protein n=1 Tax=Salpingoeca rosetta (strain ATCC 50818 / BSB-021) TaxID=946362 RepID=F2UJX4_SALR5|nr:uncharacterized protein PTSG_12747 [Salpingoeca rosetta]EGD77423.1 hypothetical protein PTSG_12747 [Salpingoeca rosetta]|eukprot:XP_004990311.1 hypothetical protein PTSG_12747 [Salpingoeca rosetta]